MANKVDELNNSVNKLAESEKKLAEVNKQVANTTNNVKQSQDKLQATLSKTQGKMDEFGKGLDTMGANGGKLVGVINKLRAAMQSLANANPLGAIATAIGVAVGAVINKYNDLVESAKEAEEAARLANEENVAVLEALAKIRDSKLSDEQHLERVKNDMKDINNEAARLQKIIDRQNISYQYREQIRAKLNKVLLDQENKQQEIDYWQEKINKKAADEAKEQERITAELKKQQELRQKQFDEIKWNDFIRNASIGDLELTFNTLSDKNVELYSQLTAAIAAGNQEQSIKLQETIDKNNKKLDQIRGELSGFHEDYEDEVEDKKTTSDEVLRNLGGYGLSFYSSQYQPNPRLRKLNTGINYADGIGKYYSDKYPYVYTNDFSFWKEWERATSGNYTPRDFGETEKWRGPALSRRLFGFARPDSEAKSYRGLARDLDVLQTVFDVARIRNMEGASDDLTTYAKRRAKGVQRWFADVPGDSEKMAEDLAKSLSEIANLTDEEVVKLIQDIEIAYEDKLQQMADFIKSNQQQVQNTMITIWDNTTAAAEEYFNYVSDKYGEQSKQAKKAKNFIKSLNTVSVISSTAAGIAGVWEEANSIKNTIPYPYNEISAAVQSAAIAANGILQVHNIANEKIGTTTSSTGGATGSSAAEMLANSNVINNLQSKVETNQSVLVVTDVNQMQNYTATSKVNAQL